MARERVVHDDPQPISVSRWVGIIFLLMMVAGLIFIIFNPAQCIDGCGPYHNTTSVADLDGDGDLDVMLNNLRHETDTIIWAGSILWTNHGGGNFTPRNIEYGGGSAATGDVDGDGDIDVVRLDYRATLFLNQGGEQDGIPATSNIGNQLHLQTTSITGPRKVRSCLAI